MPTPPAFLLVLASALSAPAAAFAPDRPGVGESTAAVPKEEVMIESGAIIGGQLGQVPLLALPSTVGRIGLGRDWELRIGTPNLVLALPGPVSASGLSVGGKVGGALGGDWSWSLVPTLRLAPLGSPELVQATAPELSANVAHNGGNWGVWGNALGAVAIAGDVAASGGGGVYYAPDDVGIFANAGYVLGSGGYGGGGGWWVFAPDAQVDLGVDVYPGELPVIAVSAGASVQR